MFDMTGEANHQRGNEPSEKPFSLGNTNKLKNDFNLFIRHIKFQINNSN